MASDPATREEWQDRLSKNMRIEGTRMETTTVAPCPFCGAPDWARWPLWRMALEEASPMREDHTCAECGRSGRFIVDRYSDGRVTTEFVQTGGDDPADYMDPRPRRVE